MKYIGALQKGDIMKEDYYERLKREYPAIKRFSEKNSVMLVPDTNFTRANTGVGNIEYLNSDSVTYSNGFTYKNPNKNGATIVYSPKENTFQDVKLDYISHALHSDEGYENRYNDFFNNYMSSTFGEEYKRNWSEGKYKAEPGVDKKKHARNNADGIIRNLMFEGTDEDFERSRYWKDAKKVYLSDPKINSAYNELINYIKGKNKANTSFLPEKNVAKASSVKVYRNDTENRMQSESTYKPSFYTRMKFKFMDEYSRRDDAAWEKYKVSHGMK